MKPANGQLSIFDIVLEKPEQPPSIEPVTPLSKPDEQLNSHSPFKKTSVTEIIKRIDRASYKVSKSKLISDVFECGAIAISNKFDLPQFDEREKKYLQIINSYQPQERELIAEIFGKIFALLSSVAYDDGAFYDYLGELFMQCSQGEKKAGQFFTPYHVSKLMAKMTITDDKVKRDEILTLYEPCCGSAGMVLASMDILKNDYGVNYARDCFVVCEDVDLRCVHMAFLQLSLAGVPAIIKHQNTLSREFWSVWRTPAYIMQYLRFRKYESLN